MDSLQLQSQLKVLQICHEKCEKLEIEYLNEFRHEIAYVLGQIQSPLVTKQLLECLRNEEEIDMVRHECAEALGSIASDEIYEELGKYLDKSQPDVLRESCVVALDFADYNKSGEFQYADALAKV